MTPDDPPAPASAPPARHVDVRELLHQLERQAFVAARELDASDQATARARVRAIRELAARLPQR